MPVLFSSLHPFPLPLIWYDHRAIGRSDSKPSDPPFVSPRTSRRTRDLQRSTRATWPRKTASRRASWAWAGRWQVIIYPHARAGRTEKFMMHFFWYVPMASGQWFRVTLVLVLLQLDWLFELYVHPWSSLYWAWNCPLHCAVARCIKLCRTRCTCTVHEMYEMKSDALHWKTSCCLTWPIVPNQRCWFIMNVVEECVSLCMTAFLWVCVCRGERERGGEMAHSFEVPGIGVVQAGSVCVCTCASKVWGSRSSSDIFRVCVSHTQASLGVTQTLEHIFGTWNVWWQCGDLSVLITQTGLVW